MEENKPGRGAPVQYTEEVLKEIEKNLLDYIDNTDIPILAEFAYKNNIRRQTLYDHEYLSDAVKKCTTKKEAALEKKALNGEVVPSMAIFSLKQLGWRDRKEINAKVVSSYEDLTDDDLDKEIEALTLIDE